MKTENQEIVRDLFAKVYEVHGKNTITGILFGIASFYQDFISERTQFFPVLILKGDLASGKSSLTNSIQKIFSHNTIAINYNSTQKAWNRAFATYANEIISLEEYVNFNYRINSFIANVWDRTPIYTESLDSIKIKSSLIVQTDDLISADSNVLQRSIIEFMHYNENFNHLKEKELKNFIAQNSFLAKEFFTALVEYTNVNFQGVYSVRVEKLSRINEFDRLPARLIHSISVLISMYDIFSCLKIFPFTLSEVIEHFIFNTRAQELNKFPS